MIDIVLLDAGPLGMISHPKATAEIVAWVARLLVAGTKILIPEIADYEVRRELLRARKLKGVKRLNQLKTDLGHLPISSAAILKAADFWADARRRGRPTSHDHSLDADMILAGQAATLPEVSVIVATTNPKHLNYFVPAKDWWTIAP